VPLIHLKNFSGGGTSVQSDAEQEGPCLAALSGKDRAYKAGRLIDRPMISPLTP